jgi:radical SAM superfamily enzyme YgiQ (UPF0313 family)
MKALFINPHKLIPDSFSLTQRASPPLGLAYVAAAVEREGFEIKVMDCVAEAPANYFSFQNLKGVSALGIDTNTLMEQLDENYNLIGLSVMFSNNWLVNRYLINLLKERFPHALIVIGGEHATAIPEYCLQDCAGLDMVVTGEGEETIAEVASCLREGKSYEHVTGIVYKKRNEGTEDIVVNPRRKRIRTVGEIAPPAWEHFPLDKYFEHDISYGIAYGRSLPIFATRGCPYECTFCSSPQMWGTKYSMRDVEDVIAEVKKLNTRYGVTNIDFYDLTAIVNKRWILDFCKALEREGLVITWQIPAGTRSEAIDFEVASALKKAGCVNITYAPESGSQEMLASIKKKITPERMLHSIDQSYKAGLDIKLNIMLGYPDERVSDIMRTNWFLIKASYYGATDASPSMFSPYPGSALFNELKERGELTLNDNYFYSIVYSQSLHHFKNYNRNNSRRVMMLMLFISYLCFYVSNYLFRPVRAFRLVLNVATRNYKTRGEYMIGTIINRFRATRAESKA